MDLDIIIAKNSACIYALQLDTFNHRWFCGVDSKVRGKDQLIHASLNHYCVHTHTGDALIELL